MCQLKGDLNRVTGEGAIIAVITVRYHSRMAVHSLAADVVDSLGRRIVNGHLQPGDVLRLDLIGTEFDVSRSVSREAMRVLESLGLVVPRRRVGVLVSARSDWNVLHPRVIRWGLEGRRRPQTLEWISQLRAAVEPVAAAMACTRATQQDSITMSVAATRMTHAAAVRDLEAYLIADEEFHSTLLSASDNPMFATLRHSVSSLLEGRTELMPFEPNLQAIAWHREVADAVAARNPDAAQAAMLNIVEEALDAMKKELPRSTGSF